MIYTIEMVRLIARAPYAWVDLDRVDNWMTWAAYAVIGLVTWWGYQPPERRAILRERARAAFAALTARLSDRAALRARYASFGIALAPARHVLRPLVGLLDGGLLKGPRTF